MRHVHMRRESDIGSLSDTMGQGTLYQPPPTRGRTRWGLLLPATRHHLAKHYPVRRATRKGEAHGVARVAVSDEEPSTMYS